jgi:hypothetical protein
MTRCQQASAGDGAAGFYVTMKRGSRTAWLLGPHDSKAEAEARVPVARRLARDVDPFTAFDAFGVTRVVMKPGATLPLGVPSKLAEGR